MATLNKVMLIGRLTDNPEPPRVLPNSGSTVVKFRFAVGRSKKDPNTGQWIPDPNPMYIDCEAFSKPDYTKLTDLITQYCVRGMQLYIEGRLQYDVWNDKDNPTQKRSKHKIVVDSIQFLDSRNPDGGGDGGGGGGMRGGGGGGRQQYGGGGGGQQFGGAGGGRPNPAPAHDDDMGPPEGETFPF